MKVYCLACVVFNLVIADCMLFANDSSFGTLVVTYQTGPKEKRLDRVRFRLEDDSQEYRLYPKLTHEVSTQSGCNRTVVINHLRAGRYGLHFLIPNADDLFEPAAPRSLEVHAGEVLKINHSFKVRAPQILENTSESIAINESRLPADMPLAASADVFADSKTRSSNSEVGSLEIVLNQPSISWALYRADLLIYRGKGSTVLDGVPAGRRYRLKVDDVEGFAVDFPERGEFSITSKQAKKIEIHLVPTYGYINLKTPFPKGMYLNVAITSKSSGKVIKAILLSDKGSVEWKSPLLPTGAYVVTLDSPSEGFQSLTREIIVTPNKPVLVMPDPQPIVGFNVKTNLEQAAFTLTNRDGSKSWRGSGMVFTFQNVPPGSYQLVFDDVSPNEYLPPQVVTVTIPFTKGKGVKAIYTRVDKERVSAAPLKAEEASKAVGELTIRSNIGRTKYRLHPLSAKDTKSDLMTEGSIVKIAIKANEKYLLTPQSVPNYARPRTRTIELRADETKEVEVDYKSQFSWILVPEGMSIIGDSFNEETINAMPSKKVYLDAFSIAAYPTTNNQYAEWLTRALSLGKITYGQTATGHVLDKQGHLLFKTSEGSKASQIGIKKEADGTLRFISEDGKEDFPVICVSWYGATQFAADRGARLPTEAEWEKAAGVEVHGSHIRKYRYGFSRDYIDRSFANYKASDMPIQRIVVLTSKVGFYDGFNYISPPLGLDDKPTLTRDAHSPYGAYDMSGNVWEFVHDWYSTDEASIANTNPSGPKVGSMKVAKGGCYDSLADGVRVAERMPLDPEYLDAFTGFRIAASP